MNDRGFTLVEMLVSLVIFALLSAAGVSLLSVSINSQNLVKSRLDEGAGIGRLSSLLSQDLATAEPRPWRDERGDSQPAFRGNDGRSAPLRLIFVRNAPEGSQGGSQRIEWKFSKGQSIRTSYTPADGSNQGISGVVMDDVGQAQLRYRKSGRWEAQWAPTNPVAQPDAVELVIVRPRGNIVMRFIVGAGR